MPLADFMPNWDFLEQHARLVRAEAPRVFQTLLDLDLSRSPLVRLLLLARALPMRLAGGRDPLPSLRFSLGQMRVRGFIPLERLENQEMVLGLVAQPWRLNPEVVALPPADFLPFSQAGYVKVAVNFLVEPLEPGLSRLSTETRVLCLGQAARRAFGVYWTIIRPGSGLIRHEMLRLTRKSAESGHLAA